MGGDKTFPGIDADNKGFPELAACLFNEAGVFYGGGA